MARERASSAGGTATSTRSPDGPAPATPPADASRALAPRYRFVAELAHGGMGRVSILEDTLLGREVAVKEVLPEAGARALRRFEREALLTARLEHPGIVPVHELVRGPAGEPYLVMRRVKGRPLDEALAAAPDLAGRLALLPALAAAVDAVAYAHGRGVVHRDLKPSNVLLGEFGEAVVIDWGLAREVASLAGEAGEGEASAAERATGELSGASGAFDDGLTRVGALLGTPAFMSPEQARGEAVDARADVYALGAILYQLLAGARPYAGVPQERLVEAVRAGPPPPVQVLEPAAAPELAAICGRAMARAPADRYVTAQALTEDLRRFLTGRLVQAHAYSTGALLRRWLRRHAAPVALTAAFVVALAVLGAVSVQRIVAEREAAEAARDRARREAEVSARVSRFLGDMFQVSRPEQAKGRTVPAREVLDRAARQLDALGAEPEVQARLATTMGDVYTSLGLWPEARPLLERALAAARGLGEGPTLAGAEVAMARLLHQEGKYADAERQVRPALAAWERLAGAEGPEALAARSVLADTLRAQSRNAEAEPLHRAVWEARRRTLGDAQRATINAANLLAEDLWRMGRYPEARGLFEETLANARRALGPDDPAVADLLVGLAYVRSRLGDVAGCEAANREALAVRTRVLGPDHPGTMSVEYGLALSLFDQERYADVEAVTRALAARRSRVLGPEHPQTLNTVHLLANALQQLHRFPEAEALHRSNGALRAKVLGAEHVSALLSRHALAQVFIFEGRTAEADAELGALRDTYARKLGPAAPEVGTALYDLAWSATRRGDRDRALALLREALGHHLLPETALRMGRDNAFRPLFRDPGFLAVVEEARAYAEAENRKP
ncbi:MAG: serine/threonine-protein kinase [Anaeromyxobacteraceae bacterium]